jgi:galactokinase
MNAELIVRKFRELYGTKPVISRAPGRVNLIGEHTDYNDGFVLPAAVDKELVFGIQKNNLDKIRVFSIDNNENGECYLNDLKPRKGWINYIIGVFSEIAAKGLKIEGTDLVFAGDVPIGAGMSSSAALECALANGLNALYNGSLDKLQLALVAQAAEHNFAGVKCGLMDQFASMFGKIDNVIKLDCRSRKYEYFRFDFSEFSIVLCDTGVKHSLASSEYNTRRAQCEAGVRTIQEKFTDVKNLRDVTPEMIKQLKNELDPIIFNRCTYVVEENIRVENACRALLKNDFVSFGELMYQSHEGLKNKYEVSCVELDLLIAYTAENNNVLGARMMGGGFGGCTINLVKSGAVKKFIKEITQLYQKETGRLMKTYVVKIGNGARVEN